jgi:hypothetical protein
MLYELTEAAKYLYSLLSNDEENAEAITDTLAAMGAEERLESCAKLIRQMENDAAGYKTEKNRLAEKQLCTENRIKRLKEEIRNYLMAAGQSRVRAGVFDIRIAKNPPKLEIVNEELLDAAFFMPQPPKLDNKAVKDALLEGREVPGAVLTYSEGVRIR